MHRFKHGELYKHVPRIQGVYCYMLTPFVECCKMSTSFVKKDQSMKKKEPYIIVENVYTG